MKSFFLYTLLAFFVGIVNQGFAKETCSAVNNKNIKVEAWLSKKYEKKHLDIKKEFLEVGNTKLGLFIYPAENPSRVMAIGRCVPAYIAQYFLKKATKYSLGTTHLVNQRLMSGNWLGMGTPIFGKNSMSKITSKQLTMLMSKTLDTESFQKMYRAFTVQNEKINIYGLILNNPRFLPKDQ